MKIEILQLIEGAKCARGCAVIIDVFRAFSVECYLIQQNVKTIIPVGDEKIAYQYRDAHPEFVLVGERHGRKIDDFDFGNSPISIIQNDFSGKTVIHRTSSGTQGIVNATKADCILTGSLVNAEAIARFIKDHNFTEVSLVCMGLEGLEPSDEDTLCAKYIKDLIEDNDTSYIYSEIENLKKTSGAKFFDLKQQEVFPEADFGLSTKLNIFDFVLKVDKEDDHFVIHKIDC